MSGILCLKWNNHTSTFIKTLDNLRSKELYCDATIACHGKFFPVHRFVLTTCSEYFEEIFERTQCKHPFIIVKDVEELQLEALLNYMYKGEVNVLQDRLPGLIRAAEALKVKGLAVSEEDAEEKNVAKEKRKSNSSPLQPKSKRRAEEKNSVPVHVPDSDDDDISEIAEIETQSLNSNSNSSKKSKDIQEGNYANSKTKNSERNQSFETIVGLEKNSPEPEEIEDIKVEPSEIFEAVEEDFPSNSVESRPAASTKEESLFVSLLSPNDSHSLSEEDLMAINDVNNHAMPQCSSWSDDVSTNSDKMHDEIDALKMKPMVSMEEGAPTWVGFEGVSDPLGNLHGVAEEEPPLISVPHQCPHCNHRTKTKPELLRHVSYAHSDFRFGCALCHYKCRTNGLLTKHMLKHTNEKPHSCPLCPYKTARKQHLVRHTKLHTGEKPFSCHFCSYRASRKDRLREHLRKHKEYNDFTFE